MAGEWGKVKLRNVLSSNGYIRGPFGSSLLRKELKTEGIPVYEQQHAIYDKRTFRYFIDEDKFKKLSRFQVRENDLIISCSGTIGKISIIQKHDPKGIISQALLLLRPNEKLITSKYLYYILSSPKGYHSIISISSGSVQVNIAKRKIVENIDILCPSIEDQRSIIHVLGTLDDKIKLNRKMNETIEAIAQALFKSWFVDFDPVIDKALAAGNPIPRELSEKAERRKQLGDKRKPLPKDIASLFPDEFEESKFGWIPKGWIAGEISILADLNPESWTKKNFPELIKYVDLANTKSGRINSIALYDFEDAPSRARRVLQLGDTIIGTVRPGNRSYAYIQQSGLTASTGFAVLRPKKSSSHIFVYLSLTRDEAIEHFAHLADGAVYPAIRPEVVSGLEIILPSSVLLSQFNNIATVWLKSIELNEVQNRLLTAIRETLLPKLISGELRVPIPEHPRINS